MVTFDEVLPRLVAEVERQPGFSRLKKCAVVRDLQGLVRLVVEDGNGEFDVARAEGALTQAIAGYFVEPILTTAGKAAEARFARALLDQAKEPLALAYVDPATDKPKPSDAKWRRLERRLSKNAWLDGGAPLPPWPLEYGPCVATFYSFKGGIGRTTALASCAWQLAEEHGKRVVVLDLDLEAPGLGALLEVATTTRGLIDVLVDHVATGEVDLTGAFGPANAFRPTDQVTVFPAGRLDGSFVEKLARLDFTGYRGTAEHASPVEAALVAVLKKIRSELSPDYIFIDARSGLHDLSGLSLNRLAHVDVIFSRASEQGYQGLALTIDSLVRRKGIEDLRCLIVHAMAGSGGPRGLKEEEEEFLARSYEVFRRSVYERQGHTVDQAELEGPHQPCVLNFDLDLVRFARLADVRARFFEPKYRELCERLQARGRTSDGS